MIGHHRRELAAIFVGGCVGALARAGLAEAAAPKDPATWPWATFAANLLGAFLLGIVIHRLPERTRPLLATGLCGALTTFSTLQLELLHMLDRGDTALALAYAAASLGAGMAAIELTHTRSRAC